MTWWLLFWLALLVGAFILDVVDARRRRFGPWLRLDGPYHHRCQRKRFLGLIKGFSTR